MYRFRSVSNLIGEFQELEKQQIYFAHPSQLNDPMEGKRIYFWQGDGIVWRNLLKHYILCLEHAVLFARLKKENEKITEEDIPVFISIEKLPTELYQERIQKIYNVFFSDKLVQSYIQFILGNPYKIYEEELYIHLKVLFNYALKAIFEVDMEKGLVPKSYKTHYLKHNSYVETLTSIFEKINDTPEVKKKYDSTIIFLNDFMRQTDHELSLLLKDSPKMQSIYISFVQMYLNKIKTLTYPEAYLACFMDNCTNSSVWGTYGNNHEGVCLKYKIKNKSNPTLTLKTIIGHGSSGNIYEYVKLPLRKVEYSTNFDELDFFKNMGRLPIPQLQKQWYSDENGETSEIGDYIFSNEEKWRSAHWKLYETAYLRKVPDWSDEREYRIVLSSVLDSFRDSKDRLLEYKLEDLESIIFGMKTPSEDRNEIINIISKKCKKEGINKFEFYEMAYSNMNREMYVRKVFTFKQ